MQRSRENGFSGLIFDLQENDQHRRTLPRLTVMTGVLIERLASALPATSKRCVGGRGAESIVAV
jgi:hypothetical protein